MIEHRIAPSTCQERQRKHYHKCFTCVHRNAGRGGSAGSAVLPPVKRVARPEEAEAEEARPAARERAPETKGAQAARSPAARAAAS